VGGVSGRPTRETKKSDLLACPRRNGERHPDSRGAGSLRGMSEERESRPVRLSCVVGLFLYVRTHRRQRVSSGVQRRGTSSAYARRTHSTRQTRKSALSVARGHVLHSVQRPVHVNRHLLSTSQGVRGGAIESVSRSGKLAQAGGTGTETGANGRNARPTACHRSSQEEVVRDASEKEEGRGLRPCGENESPGRVARTSR